MILSDLIYLCNMFGVQTSSAALVIASSLAYAFIKTKDMFSKEVIEINEYDEMLNKLKRSKVDRYNLVEQSFKDNIHYHGIKVNDKHGLLLGHDINSNPVLGCETNYVIAGTTGAGKTKKMQTLLLNWMCNKQGNVYIGDLKGVDFKYFKYCKYVKRYIDDLTDIEELIKCFTDEYNYRKELFAERDYIDLEDYNSKNEKKLREFLLIIDEYADIADEYTKGGKPIGAYKDIIRLARKCRALGGRIVLGTQRPSADVICGTLKVNCSIVGMKASKINSKIMIDEEGCERLKKREALTIIDGDLIKIFPYYLTNEMIKEFTDKLK